MLHQYAIVGLVGVALVVQIDAPKRWPKWNVLSAQICIERPGDNGVLNIRSADIVIENVAVVSLLGQRAACLYVAPGEYKVWAQSRSPFDPKSTDPAAWKSEAVTATVGSDVRVEFEVCGAGRDSVYSTWRVKKPDSGPPCQ